MLINRIGARRLFISAMIAMGASWSSSGYAIDQSVTKFGSAITLPSTTPAGTILARDYVSMQQMCGAATCSINAVSLWTYGGGTMSDGPDVPTNVSGISARLLINGEPQIRMNVTGKTIVSRQPLEVQLIRDGLPLQPGNLAGGQGGTNPAYFYICDRQVSGYCASTYTKLAIALSAKVQLVAGTCQTPDQTVVLPGVSNSAFKGVGTTSGVSGVRSFNLQFKNCPAGFNRVGYSYVPVGAPLPSISGTLPLGQASTASGVAIQIIDQKSSTPVTFNNSIRLSEYSTATGGSFSVPLTATYMQTGSKITPGRVFGALQVLMDYQ